MASAATKIPDPSQIHRCRIAKTPRGEAPSDSPVRFIGESGKYEADKLATTEQKKLPPNALAIVQQLLLWLPDDPRLYWLLGELLNAEGKGKEALDVLSRCADARNFRPEALMEHRRILKKAYPDPLPPPADTSWLPDTRKLLMVGGAACFVIVLLGYFQFREFRRRRG